MIEPINNEITPEIKTLNELSEAVAIQQQNPMEEPSDVKPYTFRKLSSVDVFPMFKIISLIGLKEFTAAIDKDVLMDLIMSVSGGQGEQEEGKEAKASEGLSIESFAVNGAAVILGIADVIFSKLPSCESYIYQLLSQTSNLSVEEIKALDLVVFTEMVIDFIKKDEFKDFIKVVSKLFK